MVFHGCEKLPTQPRKGRMRHPSRFSLGGDYFCVLREKPRPNQKRVRTGHPCWRMLGRTLATQVGICLAGPPAKWIGQDTMMPVTWSKSQTGRHSYRVQLMITRAQAGGPSKLRRWLCNPANRKPVAKRLFINAEVRSDRSGRCDHRRWGCDPMSRMSACSSSVCILEEIHMYDVGCEKRELQEAISNQFPSHTYSGSVLAVSHDPSVYDAEDDNLDILLKGKSWRSIDLQFVESNHDEYVLMNEQALPAFLAAWLWKAGRMRGSPTRCWPL